MKKGTIFVGLSGGVDSSVAALRLKNRGHDVVGVFIKVWQPDFLRCNWEQERLDAMRVAAHLDIPFLTFDAEDVYKHEVADYMIEEYRNGRTPNPDVMCNQHVKFGAFLAFARGNGASKIATGHYARIKPLGEAVSLFRAVDSEKDQSYFLWTLKKSDLSYIEFPIGDSLKSSVRKEAEIAGMPTFKKPDSQGICFLGQVDIKEFLSHYTKLEKGNVLDETGKIIGEHDGALIYTLGQRHGFNIHTKTPGLAPQYVTARDLKTNTITVSDLPQRVSEREIKITNLNLRGEIPEGKCEAQFRYRQKPFPITMREIKKDYAMLNVLDTEIEMPSAGQSCVLYRDDLCIGGGIIA